MLVMAYRVMVYKAMAYRGMAYVVMAYRDMAYRVMTYMDMAYMDMAAARRPVAQAAPRPTATNILGCNSTLAKKYEPNGTP